MTRFFSEIVLVLVYALFSISVQCARTAVPAILAFGDSIVDTGNNNYLSSITKCNFYPYGRDFVTHLPTGRWSNGRIPSDLIAEGLGIKSTVPAYRQPNLQSNDLLTGVSFASGGSGLDKFTATIGRVTSVQDQVNDFKGYVAKLDSVTGDKKKTQSIVSNALFLISAGNNDLAISYFSGGKIQQYNINEYTDLMITWTRTFFTDLYNLGARKFAVMGTLPLGCLPSARNGMFCIEPVNGAAKMFNEKLSAELNNLNAKLQGAKFVYVDMFNPLYNLAVNPLSSGFITATTPCCCSPAVPVPCMDASRYVFWDIAHPTEQAYKTVLGPIIQQLRQKFA